MQKTYNRRCWVWCKNPSNQCTRLAAKFFRWVDSYIILLSEFGYSNIPRFENESLINGAQTWSRCWKNQSNLFVGEQNSFSTVASDFLIQMLQNNSYELKYSLIKYATNNCIDRIDNEPQIIVTCTCIFDRFQPLLAMLNISHPWRNNNMYSSDAKIQLPVYDVTATSWFHPYSSSHFHFCGLCVSSFENKLLNWQLKEASTRLPAAFEFITRTHKDQVMCLNRGPHPFVRGAESIGRYSLDPGRYLIIAHCDQPTDEKRFAILIVCQNLSQVSFKWGLYILVLLS